MDGDPQWDCYSPGSAPNRTSHVALCHNHGRCLRHEHGGFHCHCDYGYNLETRCERPVYEALGWEGVTIMISYLCLYVIFSLLMLLELAAEFRISRVRKLVRSPAFYARLGFTLFCLGSILYIAIEVYQCLNVVVVLVSFRLLVGAAIVPVSYAASYGFMCIEWIRLLLETKQLGGGSRRLANYCCFVYVMMGLALPCYFVAMVITVLVPVTKLYLENVRTALELLYVLSIFCGSSVFLALNLSWSEERRHASLLFRSVYEKTVCFIFCNVALLIWLIFTVTYEFVVDRTTPHGYKVNYGTFIGVELLLLVGFFMVLQRYFYTSAGWFVSLFDAIAGHNSSNSSSTSPSDCSTISTLAPPSKKQVTMESEGLDARSTAEDDELDLTD